MFTYQDLLAVGDDEQQRMDFVTDAVKSHKSTRLYTTARDAELYDRRLNVTINRYVKVIYDLAGNAYSDPFQASHKLASGFFSRFVNQETQYLLGDGVTFTNEDTKAKLGDDFDQAVMLAGHAALVGGVSFGFWNHDRLDVFKVTEFVPLYDEESGALAAGIRFWRVSDDKPRRYVLYELDGYTDYVRPKDGNMQVLHEKRPYVLHYAHSEIDGTTIYDGENYSGFPIVPLWANQYKQSELVGIREAIDCYDLIKSGFANDIDQASLIYWLIEGAGGMDDLDLARFLDRLKTVGAASVGEDQKVEAHTQDVPYEARSAYLAQLESDLYKDYQALDVSTLAGGQKTATEIEAAYEPMDRKADLFENCVRLFLRDILSLAGVDDTFTFSRTRIANESEMTQQVLLAAPLIGDEAAIRHIPWLTPEEVDEILAERDAQGYSLTHEDGGVDE
jgi:hypothetical protein